MINSNDVQEFFDVMTLKFDKKQRRHMLVALFEIMDRSSATKLIEMTGVFITTLPRASTRLKTPEEFENASESIESWKG